MRPSFGLLIEGQNALTLMVYVIVGQNARDQITSDRRYKPVADPG